MSTLITMIMTAMMTVTTMTMMRMMTAMTMTMMMIMTSDDSDDGDDGHQTNYFIVPELKQEKVVTMLFLEQRRRTFWVELLKWTLVFGYELEKGGPLLSGHLDATV